MFSLHPASLLFNCETKATAQHPVLHKATLSVQLRKLLTRAKHLLPSVCPLERNCHRFSLPVVVYLYQMLRLPSSLLRFKRKCLKLINCFSPLSAIFISPRCDAIFQFASSRTPKRHVHTSYLSTETPPCRLQRAGPSSGRIFSSTVNNRSGVSLPPCYCFIRRPTAYG